MKPELFLTTGAESNRPLVCVIDSDELPAFIELQDYERDLLAKGLKEGKESVVLYTRQGCLAIVKAKSNLPVFRQHEELRRAASSLTEKFIETGSADVTVTGNNVKASLVLAFTEGLALSFYRFDKYITKKERGKKLPDTITISYDVAASEFEWLKRSCEAVYAARDMINEPPRKMNAQLFAQAVKDLGQEAGFSVEILDKSRIAALKMGGLLGINSGSIDPPEFCILEHKPENAVNSKPLVLIGKGVVLDTGGLNIKTGDYLNMMKTDMAGGAAVAAVLYMIAKADLPLYTVALIPVTDNRPGQNAIAPGDVLTMHNGTTVEIMNTDAEGRVILADAVSYAKRFDPLLVVTIATLTGSAAMTFGTIATAMMGTAPEEYLRTMEECGEEVYERVAPLPFWEEYGESLKSDIADIKNLGGREGGAIIGGKFLASFTDAPFIHLDIAGPAMLKKNDHYRLKEGPGTGVRLLAAFARRLASGINNSNKS